MISFSDFIKFDQASKRTIAVKRIYVDMVGGDLNAAVMLSQIVYWQPHLTKRRNGYLWLYKADREWHDEIGLTAKQAMRARKILVAKNLVITDTFLQGSTPKTHLRINEPGFMAAYNSAIEQQPDRCNTLPTGRVQTPLTGRVFNKEYAKTNNMDSAAQRQSLKSNHIVSDSAAVRQSQGETSEAECSPLPENLRYNSVLKAGEIDSEVKKIMAEYFSQLGGAFSPMEARRVKASIESFLTDGELSLQEIRCFFAIEAYEESLIRHEEALAEIAQSESI